MISSTVTSPQLRSSGDVSQSCQRCLVLAPAERGQEPGDHHRLVDRRPWALLQPAAQPPSRGAATANPRVVLGDQSRQLERLAQVDLPDLSRSRLGEEKVSTLERPAKSRSRVTLGRDDALLPGAGRRCKRTSLLTSP
jgi:hypothetical protein